MSTWLPRLSLGKKHEIIFESFLFNHSFTVNLGQSPLGSLIKTFLGRKLFRGIGSSNNDLDR